MAFPFFWMLHGNDEGRDAGGGRRVAVNWVMPACAPRPGESPKLDGDQVFKEAGALMWPWRLEIDDWFAIDADGVAQALGATGLSAVEDRQAIHALLEAELYSKCAGCDDACSLEQKYLGAALPHLFTPLTHLPAALSQDVLGMVRAFACQDLPGTVAYVPRFELEQGGRRLRFVPATAQVEKEDGVAVRAIVPYAAQYEDGQPYTEVEFSIVTNFAEELVDLAKIDAAFRASDLSEVGARALLASNALSPLVLLGRAAPDGAGWPVPSASPGQLLARTLGPGLLRIDDTGPVMIWERLPRADAHTGDDLFTAWSDTDAVFLALQGHYRADADAGSTLLAVLAPLFEAQAQPHRFAAAAAELLDRAADARVLAVAWLATIALQRASDKPSEVWVGGRSFSAWYAQIAAIAGEHEVAELQAGWWRYWVELRSGSSDARVREMHAIVERWIRGQTELTEIDSLAACYAHGMALLASAGAAPSDLPAKDARERIAALRDRLRAPDETSPVSLGEDRDLSVLIDVDQAKVQRQDQQLRGYAIAMAAGYDAAEAALDWQWMTDLALSIRNAQGKWEDFLGPDGTLLRCHDAFGAISMNGRTVVDFPYEGKALNGAMRLKGADSDGVDGMAFGWPDAWKTPPLAYGLHYWTRATPVGNGGKILDPDCARPGDDRRLKQLDAELFDGRASFRYLCRVAPGAVTIRPRDNPADARAYDMETDARAWHEQAGIKPHERIHVAVIRPRDTKGWRAGAPTELGFDLVPPDATAKLVTRWIDADIAQRKVRPGDGPLLRDPASAGRTPEQLVADRNALLARFEAKGGPGRRARHPAARAIGVEVRFAHAASTLRAVLTPVSEIERGYMDNAGVVCTAAATSAARVDASTLRIELAPGDIARLTFWTLAPEPFFAGAAAAGPLARMAGFGSEYDGFGPSWRAFARREHWFECAPSAAAARQQSIDALAKVQGALAIVMDGHDAAARIAVAGGVDATWIKGFLVQRHDWHWTGYPLALPRMLRGTPGLHEWSEAFAGTESLVESRVETLHTQARPDWRFGLPELPAELCRTRLPALHGARFVACVLRPLRRFDAWLANDAAVENLVAATGKLVAARVDWNNPALRLAPPTVRAAIPLVRTWEAGADGVGKSGNGALLCLDDVLVRTDALARFGGVGEIVDVDLEETRINDVFEIGPNPIMHAGPRSAAKVAGATAGVPLPTLERMDLPYPVHYLKDGSALREDAPMDWRVEADRPFGLTEDPDRNPKVARSAIVVRPAGTDVASYWIMAKVRLRRMLEPDPDWTAHGALPRQGANWLLARRPEGDDRIPFDFALACDPASPVRLAVGGAPGKTFAARPARARRLLCSWHKGHWTGTSETLWGLQVLEQVLEQDVGQWKTAARHSPYETTNASAGLNVKDPAPVLLAGAANAGAQRLLLSDYGEAHWLTFIGMPWRHPSFANESCWMEKVDGGLRLLRSGVGYGVEVISRDLLVNPVRPADLAGARGAERSSAEPSTFHLLLVFARVDDIAAPAAANPLGQLAGVYRPTRAEISAAAPYPPLRFEPFMKDAKMPKGALGYLYKFQSSGANPDSWEALLAGMFPEHGHGEATVRWLPEFAGPFGTGRPVDAPALAKGAIRIDVGALGRVDIRVDQARGWARVGHSGSKNPWQDDLEGGSCTLAPGAGPQRVLALEGGGGRLLARLDDWEAAAGGAASVYDDKGTRFAALWNRL